MTFEVPIFWCVDEETRAKLKELMHDEPPVIIDIEPLKELEKIMKQKPRTRMSL